MKKALSLVLAIIMIMALASSAFSLGYSGDIYAESVLLLDASNSRKLYAKDANVTVEPAGTTKLMTALVAYENIKDLSEEITITDDDLEGIQDGADLTLSPMMNAGERFTMKDVLCGMLIASGNDAASALAVHVAGSVEKFVELMNKKAAELGMNSTRFANPHGKSDDGHYTTAEDMSKLAIAILNTPELMDIISKKTYVIPETDYYAERNLNNTNALFSGTPEQMYTYATGMMGGYTGSAGGCLVASAKKDNHNLICLVFGDRESGEDRWIIAKKLFEYGFSSYITYSAEELFSGVELTEDPNTTIVQDFTGISICVPEVVDVKDPVAEFSIPEDKTNGEGKVKYYSVDGTFLAEVPFTYSVKKPLIDIKGIDFGKILKIAIIAVIVIAIIVVLLCIAKASRKKKKTHRTGPDARAYQKNVPDRKQTVPRREYTSSEERQSDVSRRTAGTAGNKQKRKDDKEFKYIFRRYFPTVCVFLILAIIVIVIVALIKSKIG